MRPLEWVNIRTNVRTYVRTYVLTYIRTGQTLYPLHNFVVRGDNNSSEACSTIHRYPILSLRYTVMCKIYTGYYGTSEIEIGLCACMVDNPLAKARRLSFHTGAQTMLYLSQKSLLNLVLTLLIKQRPHDRPPPFPGLRMCHLVYQ